MEKLFNLEVNVSEAFRIVLFICLTYKLNNKEITLLTNNKQMFYRYESLYEDHSSMAVLIVVFWIKETLEEKSEKFV